MKLTTYLIIIKLLLIFSTHGVIAADQQSLKTDKEQPSTLEQAVVLYQQGEKTEAEKLLDNFIQAADYNNPSMRSLIYRSYLTLADMYARRSAFNQEVRLFQQLLKHLTNWQLGNSVDAVTIRQRLGEVFIQAGQEKNGTNTLNEGLQLAIKIFPANDVRLANLRLSLAKIHINRLETEEANLLLEQVKQSIKNNSDQDSKVILGRAIQAQGELFFRQAKTKKASKTYLQAFEYRQKLFGLNHLETAQSLVSYASTLKGLHRFSEAEELFRQGFAIYDAQLGSNHVYIATLLSNMGQMYYLQGRFTESEKALLRALEIKKTHFSENHISLASTYNHLGYLYFLLENYDQAQKYLDNAVRIWSLADSSRPRYRASAATWKAVILSRIGKSKEAIEKLRDVINILESIYGQDNIATADAYYHLGKILHGIKQSDKAETAYIKGLKSAGQFGQGDWLAEILINSELAKLYVEKGKFKKALTMAQDSLNGVQLRIKRFSGLRAHSLTTELKSLREAIITNISVFHTIMQADSKKMPDLSKSDLSKQDLLELTFRAAQISRASSVARAMAQVEKRFASGSDQLAAIVRERQDLLELWQEIDSVLTAAMSSPDEKRNRKEEVRLIDRSNEIKKQIEIIDHTLREDYPNYSDLTQSPPMGIKQAQALLGQDESLLVYLFGKEISYLWVITPHEAELFQLDITSESLDSLVRRLRHRLIPRNIRDINRIPPFPVKHSHLLYKKILEPAMPLLQATNNLFVVADKAIQSLPLSVLITALPKQRIKTPAEHLKAAWLINDKTLAALPAVSALSTLRNNNLSRISTKNFLGIGDPALKEAAQKYQLRSSQLLKQSESNLSVTDISENKQSQTSGVTRGITIKDKPTLRSILGSRGAKVDIEQISSMVELPDTADELRIIANILTGSTDDIYLRDKATERQILAVKADEFKIIQFATHGLMAGEFQGLQEPALVLTPDIDYDINDNGLLTASDITQLKLNADFVVLSACNTAADDGTPGAEGLSGLGRSFLYAGSRALLVTHWSVVSDAAVKMTTKIVDYLHNADRVSITMAHQKSTVDLMNNKEKPYYAHPMFWAPFMIVGGHDRQE